MIPPVIGPATLRGEQGFGLIELLVSMLIALVVSLAAFSILQFTTDDVSRITERTHVDQTGRVALEKIMLQLHSACVSLNVNPVQPKSTESAIKFVSETSPLNTGEEPVSSLPSVKLHEIAYSSAGKGTLTEKTWKNVGTKPGGEYKFNNESETPVETKLLLTGVTQTTATTPIFRYYRYYEEKETTTKLGQINTASPMTNENLATVTGENTTTEKTEAEKVAEVTVAFTLKPEGHESIIAKGGQPIALEDSATFRLATSSESSPTNFPCTQQT